MYALLDCNNFFVSCERLFDPKLRDHAVVVLSNNDGCVIARSNEAKQLGIPMGVPMFKIRDLVEQKKVLVRSSNYVLYGDISQRVMGIIRQYFDQVEIYSIDEAFIDLESVSLNDLETSLRELRQYIFKCLHIPVSIGVAKTKTLAKVANHKAKKYSFYEGVYVLTEEEKIKRILAELEPDEIWGIGRRLGNRLKEIGVTNALELTLAQDRLVQQSINITGLRTKKELEGQACITFEKLTKDKQTICVSRSFANLIRNFTEIEEALANFATRAAEKLRRQHSKAQGLYVFIRGNPFKKDIPYVRSEYVHCFDIPTADTSEIITACQNALKQIYDKTALYKKAGVLLFNISKGEYTQLSLFNSVAPKEEEQQRQKFLEQIDYINHKFSNNKHGNKAICFAAQYASIAGKFNLNQHPRTIRKESRNYENNWQSRRDFVSAAFTTRWDEVLRVWV